MQCERDLCARHSRGGATLPQWPSDEEEEGAPEDLIVVGPRRRAVVVMRAMMLRKTAEGQLRTRENGGSWSHGQAGRTPWTDIEI